jgi:hypothetical protein
MSHRRSRDDQYSGDRQRPISIAVLIGRLCRDSERSEGIPELPVGVTPLCKISHSGTRIVVLIDGSATWTEDVTVTDNQAHLEDLPDVITAFLRAHQSRDLDNALERFSSDATVIDDGRTYSGLEDIRSWMSSSTSEFTYTTETVAACQLDAGDYDVVQHLEGNFPGGTVDLHFRFALRDGELYELVIEP